MDGKVGGKRVGVRKEGKGVGNKEGLRWGV